MLICCRLSKLSLDTRVSAAFLAVNLQQGLERSSHEWGWYVVLGYLLLYGRTLCAVVGVVSSPGQSAEASANAVQPLRVRLSRVNDHLARIFCV